MMLRERKRSDRDKAMMDMMWKREQMWEPRHSKAREEEERERKGALALFLFFFFWTFSTNLHRSNPFFYQKVNGERCRIFFKMLSMFSPWKKIVILFGAASTSVVCWTGNVAVIFFPRPEETKTEFWNWKKLKSQKVCVVYLTSFSKKKLDFLLWVAFCWVFLQHIWEKRKGKSRKRKRKSGQLCTQWWNNKNLTHFLCLLMLSVF